MGTPHDEQPLLVSLLDKVLEVQARRRPTWKAKKQRAVAGKDGGHVTRRPGRILMKRRARLDGGSRRAAWDGGIDRRVRALRKLIPRSTESVGLDGLFRETADYILALEMRVKVMQIMVKVLTGSDEE